MRRLTTRRVVDLAGCQKVRLNWYARKRSHSRRIFLLVRIDEILRVTRIGTRARTHNHSNYLLHSRAPFRTQAIQGPETPRRLQSNGFVRMTVQYWSGSAFAVTTTCQEPRLSRASSR